MSDRNAPKATFHVLLYGHYTELARRCLESIRKFVPRDEYLLRIGMNACCRETLDYVDGLAESMPIELFVRSDVNLHKYPMMRKMFWDKPLETDWIVWFDDDTHIISDKWWAGVWKRLEQEPAEAVGKLLWWIFQPGEWDFVQKRPWFRGRESEQGRRFVSPAARFMLGAYWLMKTECIRALDWPDPALVAQGGDTLLGAAIWQQEWRQIHFEDGIKVNAAPRRTVTMPRVGVESKDRPEEILTLADRQIELPDWTTMFAERRHLDALESRLEEKNDWLIQQLSDTVSLLRSALLDQAVKQSREGLELEEIQRQTQQAWLNDPKLRKGLALCVAERNGSGRKAAEVDCAGRLDKCGAICCRMLRALSEEEVAAGKLAWSVANPFLLPIESDGYCTHLDRTTLRCSLDGDRPEACRAYTCERDRRIWDDFKAAVPGPQLRPDEE